MRSDAPSRRRRRTPAQVPHLAPDALNNQSAEMGELNSGYYYDKKRKRNLRQRTTDWVVVFLCTAVATFALVSISCLFPGLFRTIHVPGRPHTDKKVNRIPVSIPNLDFNRWNNDIGGWLFFHQFFLPENHLPSSHHRDYNELTFVGVFGKPRTTRPDEAEVAEAYLLKLHSNKYGVAPAYDTGLNIQDEEKECKRQSWMELYNPSCNAVHELDLTYDFDEDRVGLGDDQMFDTFYISSGYWRDVWVVNQVQQDVKSILKMSRWKHDYDMEVFKYTLNDAMIMERLTKSPRIVDVFGHCGFAVWVEAIPYEVEEVVVPDGYIKQEELHDEEELKPQNDYTDEEKLDIALSMAESIADLHGFEDGLIIHDDIQLCQWLQTKDGRLKLGDFNRAEIPLFDPEKQEYCMYNNGHGYGNYRSPEEFAAKDLNEKIDVFSFGNNIYGLLTGLWVFYENEDDGVVHRKMKKGETAFIDDRYRTQSVISGKLVEVMEKCWSFKAQDRIEIFEAVQMLRLAKSEYYENKIQGEAKQGDQGQPQAHPDNSNIVA